MGGGRGYGPTHSQNIEKHFAGIPGLRLLVLHGRTRIGALYRALRESTEPTLVIENKLLYREESEAELPEGYARRETAAPYPTTVLEPREPADLTIVAFGRMSVLVERVAAELARDEEVSVELLFPLGASPFDVEPVLESIRPTGKLLVVEEGAAHFDLGSEVIAAVTVAYHGALPLRARRVSALPVPIPSSPALEREVLPSAERIRIACLELFDE
jgi:2-oxoisovalerate dehydrogenase E1 component